MNPSPASGCTKAVQHRSTSLTQPEVPVRRQPILRVPVPGPRGPRLKVLQVRINGEQEKRELGELSVLDFEAGADLAVPAIAPDAASHMQVGTGLAERPAERRVAGAERDRLHP